MPSLWFITPAHGRAELAAICLRQLRRTCDALSGEGIEATAVVVGNDKNLKTAQELGFGTVRRNNDFLGRKFNDGFQLACDPEYNPRPADYAMPFGSDDWIDHRIIVDSLPPPDTVLCFRNLSLVNPEGTELTYRIADNPGGCGMRIYPRYVLKQAGYRPVDEDRNVGCDSSILANLRGANWRIHYADSDPRQIVDWKSATNQVHPYKSVAWRAARPRYEPFTALDGLFPNEALDEMRTRF